MAELKPCPFCGGKVNLVLCDDEGNLHDEVYRERPYSGLGFMLRHAHEENLGCPIASYECDGGILGGVYIYDTEEQAAEAWNRRVDAVQGRWGTGRFNLETGNYEEQCTRCRNFSKEYGKPYCPNCGAKMDGGDLDG